MVDIQEASLEQVNMLFSSLDRGHRQIDPQYLHGKIAKHVEHFGLAAVLEALRVGTASYHGDALKALQRLGGICANMANPELSMKSIIIAIIKKKFPGRPWVVVAGLLDKGRKEYGLYFLKAVKEWIDEDIEDYTDEYWDEFCYALKYIITKDVSIHYDENGGDE